jgi:hypothetical protein
VVEQLGIGIQRSNERDQEGVGRLKGELMKVTIVAIAMLLSTPAFSNEIPETLHFQKQMFGLICGTPDALRDELLNTHGEVPVVAGLLDGGVQYILYASKDKNTMSFVIHKSETEGCLVWSGASELGQAFMLNPTPNFPAKETSADAVPEWNS